MTQNTNYRFSVPQYLDTESREILEVIKASLAVKALDENNADDIKNLGLKDALVVAETGDINARYADVKDEKDKAVMKFGKSEVFTQMKAGLVERFGTDDGKAISESEEFQEKLKTQRLAGRIAEMQKQLAELQGGE